MSRKMPLSSNLSKKPLKISWVIASTWLMQESPSLKLDWLEEVRSFLKSV